MFLRGVGTLCVGLSGWACGMLAVQKKRKSWQQIHTFVRLLAYLQNSIQYRELPMEAVLNGALRYEEFSCFQLWNCHELKDVPLPMAFQKALRAELQADMEQVAFLPHEAACKTLQQMREICSDAEQEHQKRLEEAIRLYPKLGACAGILLALGWW